MMFVLEHFWSIYFSIGAIAACLCYLGAMNTLDKKGGPSPSEEMMLSLVWVKVLIFGVLLVAWPLAVCTVKVSFSKGRRKQ